MGLGVGSSRIRNFADGIKNQSGGSRSLLLSYNDSDSDLPLILEDALTDS